MLEIVPTILTKDASDFNQFMTVYKTFAKRLQIDISDGTFAPSHTVTINDITIPPDYTGKIDIHMMVRRPSAYIPALIMLKPSLVIFHAECEENLLPIFEELSSNGIKTGIAMLSPTYPGDIRAYIQAVDHALIFAGELGRQGAKADLLQIEKVNIIKSIDSKVEIGWDGGINLDNIRTLAHTGIDVLNVGSAISGEKDPAAAFKSLEEESDKQGVNL